MELYPVHGSSPNPFFIPPHLLFPTYFIPHNYVHWTQTPDSHIYTANLPGVRKEEIRVEVENSRYLVIRTDLTGDDGEVIGGSAAEGERRSFMRKFRLPQMVNLDGISAGYENGVLTVRVPRSLARRRPTVDDVIDLTAEEARNSVARAA